MFNDLNKATRGLLLTTCATLNDARISYVIAGGWIPVLRGGAQELQHPGTRDVDVLLSDNQPVDICSAAEALLRVGFFASAKHEFQLLRPIDVGARTFVFNVDLMHQGEVRQPTDMFSDMFDLGIPDSYDPTGKRWVKSIAFGSSAIIFEQDLWSKVRVEGLDADGTSTSVAVPLMDEVAFVLSKVDSVRSPKRTRDAFDLLYVVSGPNAPFIEARMTELCRFPAVASRVRDLNEWISTHRDGFDANVALYARVDEPSRPVTDFLSRVLHRIE
jgi:hypothetical protein